MLKPSSSLKHQTTCTWPILDYEIKLCNITHTKCSTITKPQSLCFFSKPTGNVQIMQISISDFQKTACVSNTNSFPQNFSFDFIFSFSFFLKEKLNIHFSELSPHSDSCHTASLGGALYPFQSTTRRMHLAFCSNKKETNHKLFPSPKLKKNNGTKALCCL